MRHTFEPNIQVDEVQMVLSSDGEALIASSESSLHFRVNKLIEVMRQYTDRAYLVSWQDQSLAPIGAKIGNKVLARAQHGRLFSAEGIQFGVYERIQANESGAEKPRHMLMLAFPQLSS